jgi:hypothetical protein
VDDYLDRDGLLALDLSEAEADALLAASALSGHDGRRVVEAERVPDLLEALREGRGQP